MPKLKIGDADYEVPQDVLVEVLKQSGMKVVDDEDYTRKAEASNDLSKLRKLFGEDRSIEEIGEFLKKAKEDEDKRRTKEELLAVELEKFKKEREELQGSLRKMAYEVRSRDIKDYFEGAAKKEGVALIGPIMEKVMTPFYSMKIDTDTEDGKKAFDEKVKAALAQGKEIQDGEFRRLGLTAGGNDDMTFSGGGFRSDGNKGMTDNDVNAILAETSAKGSSRGAPFLVPMPDGK